MAEIPFYLDNRVILITRDHGDDEYNPVWRGCCGLVVGTIIENDLDQGGFEYRVRWDNGKSNIYRPGDLRILQNEEIIFNVKIL
jgi:hypothetical protein